MDSIVIKLKSLAKSNPRIAIALIIAVLILAVVFNNTARNSADEVVLDRNELLNNIAANLLRTQIERVFVMGIVYANNQQMIRNIERNNWRLAINSTASIMDEYPGALNAIFLSDVNGRPKEMLSVNESILKDNFISKDWYEGVSSDWQPYLSKLYKTLLPTGEAIDVNAFAIPIFNARNRPIAVLVLEMKSDLFGEWVDGIKLNGAGGISILDQEGQIVSTRGLSGDGKSLKPSNFLNENIIEKILEGSSGTVVQTTPVKGVGNMRIIYSFTFLPEYNWGVVTGVPK